jgi:sugar phosphate permease
MKQEFPPDGRKMRQLKKLHYAWVIAAVTFLTLLLGAGIRATPSILITPIEKELGWTAATISAAIAINILLYGLIGPFAAAVMERFGLRRTVTCSLLVLAGAVALTAFMSTPWQMMILWGIFVGSGTGMIALVLGATVVERWFVRHRGLVLGILTASGATGQLVFLPFLAVLSTNFGWRAVSLTVALIALLLAPICALVFRNRPADLGLARFGDDEVQPVTSGSSENPVKRAFAVLNRGTHSRDFWLLSGTFFICGASTNGLIGTHLIPACIDRGIPEVRAAGLLAAMGIFDLIGTTVSGWLTDRFDSRKLLFTYYALRGLSLLFLPLAFNLRFYGLSVYAVFYGLDWVATVPPTVKLAEQSFGEANAAVMFGWIAACHQIGAAAVAWLAGLIRTETGDYSIAFLSSGWLCLLAALLSAFIGTRSRETLVLAPARDNS